MLRNTISKYVVNLPTNRLGKGIIWSVLGSGISQGCLLLSSIPVAKMLGSVAYGQVGLLQSTLSTFAIFAGPTLGLTSQKFIAEFRHTDTKKVSRIIRLTLFTAFVLSAILAIGMFGGAKVLAEKTFNNEGMVNSVRIAALALFFNGYNGAQTGVLAGFEDFKGIAIMNLVKGITAFPLMVALTWQWGVDGTVLAIGLNAVLGCMLSAYFINRHVKKLESKVSFKSIFIERKILSSYSLPAFMGGVVTVTATWMANTILVNQSNGYHEMGLFNLANQWRIVILFLPSLINQPFLSVLSNYYGAGDYGQYKKAIILNFILTSCTAILPSLSILFGSDLIISRYGTEYHDARSVLIILSISTILVATISVAGNAISSIGKMWQGCYLNILWCITFGILLHLESPLTAQGLAWAYCLSYAVYFVIVLIYVIYQLNIKNTQKKYTPYEPGK